jgi:hypothetical protein
VEAEAPEPVLEEAAAEAPESSEAPTEEASE